MEEVFEKLRYLFKYRNSPFFNNEIFVNEKDFLEWLKIPDTDVDTFTNKLLNELLSLTGLDKNELKKALGTENYYNLLLFFFDVNSCLKNLISKETASKNYIQEAINGKKKAGLFRNLTKDKMNDILSFFSEIFFGVCHTPIHIQDFIVIQL